MNHLVKLTILVIFTISLISCKTNETPQKPKKASEKPATQKADAKPKAQTSKGKFDDLLPMIKETFGLHTGDGPKELKLTEFELKQLKEAFHQSMTNTKNRAVNDRSYLLYGGYEPLTVKLTHILNRKAGIAWTSYSHTGVPVSTYAIGVNQNDFNGTYDNTDIFKKLKTAMNKAKNIFLFIGDGMGMAQLSAAEHYATAIENNGKVVKVKKFNSSQFPAQGFTRTLSANSYITDSSAAATALASGEKTLSGVVGMDKDKKRKLETIAEIAKKKDMRVGIVSTVSIDHATPACFYAHEPSRNNYYEISVALAKSNFDYFGGGGAKKPTGSDKKQKNVYDIAKENGYKIVKTPADFKALKPGGKVWAVDASLDRSKAMTYQIDRKKDDLTIVDYTAKGIELLNNPKGFFFMIEAGKIDWACHANDAASAIQNTMILDKAVAKALDFYKQHPNDTLIVVTGDHETGGMTLGFAGTKYQAFFDRLKHQKTSHEAFNTKLIEYKKKQGVQ